MCGIAGIWSSNRFGQPDQINADLWSMVETIRHRGPDGEGVWLDDHAGLAHTRLAILDLTDAGAQPMSDKSGNIHITFNGEIYNFREIREQLAENGYSFATESDTEVLIEAYRCWGSDMISRLRGMFAFALWDAQTKTLLLTRDRLGKKPLYYAWYQNRLYFGSEIKAILAASRIPRTADIGAIHRYLTYQYVPDDETGFEAVKQLRPGAFMRVDGSGNSTITTYWSPPDPATVTDRPITQMKEEFVSLFDKAVSYRLVSDVPVGAFLSGGIDSASVVASMSRHASGPVKTFTMGFDEPNYDERAPAKLVAERYGTEHHEHVVKPDVIQILEKLVWHYGVPYADSSAVPSFSVSELARQHVKVAMNGDGGDETFLGYSRYAGAKLAGRTDILPAMIKRGLGNIGRALPFAASDRRLLRYLKRFLKEIDASPQERYGRWVAYFSDEDKQSLYTGAMRDHLSNSAFDLLAPYFQPNVPVEACAAWADFHGYLPDDLLVKIDIATMSCGLEARSPFLDHELVEYASSIPAHQRLKGLRTKSLLKDAMADRLPPSIIDRPKSGFGVPIDHWLRSELKDLAYDTLLSETALNRGLFERDAIKTLLDDHVSGTASNQYKIWALLFLEMWFRMWIDSADLPERPTAPAIRIL